MTTDQPLPTSSPPARSRSHHARFDMAFPLIYALCYGLVALGIHLAYFPIGDLGVETDFYGELAISAQRLWAGDFSVTNYPYKGPFYSIALLPVYAVVRLAGGHWYLSAVILNVLCAAATLVVTYHLLLWLFGRGVAVWATVATSLVYELFLHAHKASSDVLFLLLWQGAVLLLVKAGSATLATVPPPRRAAPLDAKPLPEPQLADGAAPRNGALTGRRPGWRLIAAGLLSGLAFLTRYNGLILPVAAVLMLVLVNPAGWPRRRRWQAAAAYLVAFLAVAAPWYGLNHAQTGRWLATRNLQNIFLEEFYGEAQAGHLPPEGVSTLPGIILHDPGHFLAVFLRNIPEHLWQDRLNLLGGLPSLLVLLGLLRLLLFPPLRRQWAYFLFPILYFLAMCLVYHQPRFFFPLAPAYLAIGISFLFGAAPEGSPGAGRLGSWLFAGPLRGLRSLGDGLAGKHGHLLAAGSAAILLLVLGQQVTNIVGAEKYYYQRRPLFILDAASFLKAQAGKREPGSGPAPSRILARKPHIAYYSGLGYEPYPPVLGSAADFLTLALDEKVSYITYSEIEHGYYPGVFYLDHLDDMTGVSRIYQAPEIKLYEIDPHLSPGQNLQNEAYAEGLRELATAEAAGDSLTVMAACGDLAAIQISSQEWQSALSFLERERLLATRLAVSAAAVQAAQPAANTAGQQSANTPGRPGTNHTTQTLTAAVNERFCSLRLDLSLVYFQLGRYEDGLMVLQDSLDKLAARCDAAQLGTAHSLLARNYKELGQIDLALQHLENARDLYVRAGNRPQATLMQTMINQLRSGD